jgi:hypothetical protein
METVNIHQYAQLPRDAEWAPMVLREIPKVGQMTEEVVNDAFFQRDSQGEPVVMGSSYSSSLLAQYTIPQYVVAVQPGNSWSEQHLLSYRDDNAEIRVARERGELYSFAFRHFVLDAFGKELNLTQDTAEALMFALHPHDKITTTEFKDGQRVRTFLGVEVVNGVVLQVPSMPAMFLKGALITADFEPEMYDLMKKNRYELNQRNPIAAEILTNLGIF